MRSNNPICLSLTTTMLLVMWPLRSLRGFPSLLGVSVSRIERKGVLFPWIIGLCISSQTDSKRLLLFSLACCYFRV
ncbi:uncharacterized protein P174DRAFT_285800 [Aspergillus novofumigatus IBT 16806]|uniref:Secreted protein n=1 Tax=Aspergillus novofumigatus (strain IBT 16806) TaxID=1392255 RepID=A0A2I1C0P0_ASPN1|nr:uncharacterized protein P174DRAFT_285800 [Aspergillus novofumigatus IBT 16806]PKX91204.1 hypothetical protein P174DRAFT_285800 [Aspergillus novofumigatus IBT 16806]